MLNENENYLTDVKDLCESCVNVVFTNALSIGCPDEIDMTKSDFLTVTISKHTNHESVKTCRAYIEDGLCLDVKEVNSNYVLSILLNLKSNKATG